MRPQFHFTADTGWINDPHGITARQGGYHAFFQYVPDSTQWAASCHWGHAAGPDLLSLTELPAAIAPGEGDDGIWTGALVTEPDGGARIFYTATTAPDLSIGRVRVATPASPDWVSWRKGDVVVDAPVDLDLIAYRDPFVIRDPDAWRMLVGAGTTDGTAMALSYRSDDLDAWTYEGVALQRSTDELDPLWLGTLWECPQVIEVDGAHAMVFSVWADDVLHHAAYALGTYAAGTFAVETWGRLTHGPSYYAPSSFRDGAGRPCLLFWMRGVEDLEAGWAGAHSVPYVLGLDGERLVATPHPDLERYRAPAVPTGVVQGRAADVEWSPPGDATLNVTSAGEEVLEIRVGDGLLEARAAGTSWQMPFDGGDVRVILDAQTVEISCRSGLLGLVAEPRGESLHVVASNVTVHPLAR
ncbi:glycoside hydrolase family 32 protein [Terrabacter sp. 2RAF25]|uniref:glycoside hydrolase family 32 protein n=1 Tax=Terrabacter sp. 2RAF25 TaxID=3232998 RepID=UPI003F9A2084